MKNLDQNNREKNQGKILLTFYGDDFTGSTDALEFISGFGAKAMLFTEPPSAQQLEKWSGLNVIVIAGKTRSLPADELEQVCAGPFATMRSYRSDQVDY